MAKAKDKVKEVQYAILSYIHPKNAGMLSFSNYKDETTGETIWLKDSAGNVVERTVRPPKVALNLKNKEDKLFYEFVQHHIYVVGANPMLKLTNVNKDAKDENATIEATMKMNAKVITMGSDELLDYGLILGYDSKLGDTEVIKNRVYKHIAANPVDALARLNDADYKLRVLVHKSIEADQIKEEGGVFKYGTLVIGTSFDQILAWLKDNPIVREALKNQLEPVEA